MMDRNNANHSSQNGIEKLIAQTGKVSRAQHLRNLQQAAEARRESELMQMVQALRDVFEELRQELGNEVEEALATVPDLIKAEIKKAFTERCDEIAAIVGSLPVPQIIVPENAIHVQMEQAPAPVVNFAPNVNVPAQEPPTIHVQPAEVNPVINVAQPEINPVIQFHAPERTRIEKEIVYDSGSGKPTKIIETTVSEEVEPR